VKRIRFTLRGAIVGIVFCTLILWDFFFTPSCLRAFVPSCLSPEEE
jgi:hypothetical protein